MISNNLELRPKPHFIRKMWKEEPPPIIRRTLLRLHADGGIDFEDSYKPKLGKLNPRHYIMLTKTSEKNAVLSNWVYVGEGWWCALIRKRYQFGKLVAGHLDKDDQLVIDEPWDDRKHELEQPPEVVISTKDKRSGVIRGYNGWEVFISWLNPDTGKYGPQEPCRNIEELQFKYREDYIKYLRIFSKIKRL